MKREAKFQTVFNQYLRKRKLYGFFELKQTTKNHVPFDAVEPHQISSLRAAEAVGLVWKLSDVDPRIKPCDCVSITPMRAYIVVKYFTNIAYIISLDRFLEERDSTDQKSLYESRAKQISSIVLKL